MRDVLSGMLDVAKVGHVWIAAVYGALVFGTLLAAGVVWAPRLMLVRGLPPDIANVAASVLWLGMAAGCLLIPWWSDVIEAAQAPGGGGYCAAAGRAARARLPAPAQRRDVDRIVVLVWRRRSRTHARVQYGG